MQRLERGLSGLLDRADGLVDSQINPLLTQGNQLIDRYLGHFLTETNYCLTPHFHGRKFLQAVLPRAFPYEFTDFEGRDSFGRVMENRKKGRGTIIGITHHDKGEAPSIIGMILNQVDDEYLASDGRVIIPVAYHQMKHVGLLARFLAADMLPLATEDTMALERKKGIIFSAGSQETAPIRQGEGLDSYIEKARDAVRNGGVIFAAIQGGRRPTLGKPGTALGLLLLQLERKGMTNYDVLLIGSGLKVWERDEAGNKRLVEVENYVGRDGFNWDCVHSFRAGPSVTRDELMATLDSYHAQFGGGKQSEFARLRQADRWAFDMIRNHGLVDAAYLQDPKAVLE